MKFVDGPCSSPGRTPRARFSRLLLFVCLLLVYQFRSRHGMKPSTGSPGFTLTGLSCSICFSEGSIFHGGTITGTFSFSVATVICGQLRPLKLSKTSCEYCSCRKFGLPFTVSIQKVADTSTDTAFGPPALPARNAVLLVPPPVTGDAGFVSTCRVAVERMVCPAIAA